MGEDFQNDLSYRVNPLLQDSTNIQTSPTLISNASSANVNSRLGPVQTAIPSTASSMNRPTWLPLQQHIHHLRHTSLLPAVESSFVHGHGHGHRRSASAGINVNTSTSNSPSFSHPSSANFHPQVTPTSSFYPSSVFSTPPSSADSFTASPTVSSKYSLASSNVSPISPNVSNSPRRHAKSHSVATVSSPAMPPLAPLSAHALPPPPSVKSSPLPTLNSVPPLLRPQPRILDGRWRPSTSHNNSPTHSANPSFSGNIVNQPSSSLRPDGGGHRHRRSTGSLSLNSSIASTNNYPAGGSGNTRRNLFSPYLPQSSIPSLLAEHRLVTGVLVVSKKNRSDAFVNVNGLDAEVFICGSKDRNRALEGDVVAVELLDVEEVWTGKLEKEENRRRKDPISTRGSFDNLANDSLLFEVPQRSAIKARDDEQVEGQTLFLLDQKQLSSEEKPKYAGHVVAVLQRAPGQVFSGSLGILRPSSAANKERQGTTNGGQGPTMISGEKPKIVWFKPSDKRVPLIAIPTEQAPSDFLNNDQKYSHSLFLASIKRWPVTSLHPFGMLVGELGPMNYIESQVAALLHDTGAHTEPWEGSAAASASSSLDALSNDFLNNANRSDYRSEDVFMFTGHKRNNQPDNSDNKLDDFSSPFVSSAFHIRPTGNGYHVGIHITDVSRIIEPGSPLDRELQRRGNTVSLCQRTVSLFPPALGDALALKEGKDCYTISLLLDVSSSGKIRGTWVGWAVIHPRKAYPIEKANELLESDPRLKLFSTVGSRIRVHHLGTDIPLNRYCNLVRRWDEENSSFNPNQTNLFASSPVEVLRETYLDTANRAVASHLRREFRDSAFLRVQKMPSRENCRMLQSMAVQMGCVLDLSSPKSLLRSLCLIEDETIRNILQLYYYKITPRAVYEMPKYRPDIAMNMLNLTLDDETDDLTHFTEPLDRYADLVVHYQLQLLLQGETASEKRLRVWSQAANDISRRLVISKFAQETSVHIKIFSEWVEKHQPWQDGVVCFIAPSYFDVFFPGLGMEKRVHLDLLNLIHVRYEEDQGILSLYGDDGAVRIVKLLSPVRVKLFAQLSTPPLINVSKAELV
ncbi:RNB-like protein [Schizosaccharomyces cryophilus OY26]|uniref:RNB-like protein n=1 Tax=Schizosaccharomyces cryophilus (strain OY26 / ATCC MYA-4695 / CBS 11777 / NBRC 106824 / NRRL Y48691) TaxID=653667 RepID=S9WYV9_SCHCR|nr:RNB-like protein [Schizosaccharomyces cryophilus OY26]EPY49872.1 RNB-like protein [Schizosaccharomyces cryophilus OY26]